MEYATYDLGLEVTIHGLKMWSNYLMGKRFEFQIDHNGLKHLFGHPNLNSRKLYGWKFWLIMTVKLRT